MNNKITPSLSVAQPFFLCRPDITVIYWQWLFKYDIVLSIHVQLILITMCIKSHRTALIYVTGASSSPCRTTGALGQEPVFHQNPYTVIKRKVEYSKCSNAVNIFLSLEWKPYFANSVLYGYVQYICFDGLQHLFITNTGISPIYFMSVFNKWIVYKINVFPLTLPFASL